MRVEGKPELIESVVETFKFRFAVSSMWFTCGRAMWQ